MNNATWYLGPLGDLRALPCPEPDITDTTVRYGGIHQGLSGARTVDVTGYRTEYGFEFEYLEPEEFRWLRAMHTRMVPGPYRLIDPRYKNRLSPQSTAMWQVAATPDAVIPPGLGFFASSVVHREWVHDAPTEVPEAIRSLRISNYPTFPNALYFGRFDFGYGVPVHDGETITYSIYVRSAAEDGEDQPFQMVLDYYNRDLVQVGGTGWQERVATPEWQRFTLTATMPTGIVAVVPALGFGTFSGETTHPLHFAAPQLEAGDTATEWDLGGGSKTVHIASLETSSPRFPLTNCTLTLLEA